MKNDILKFSRNSKLIDICVLAINLLLITVAMLVSWNSDAESLTTKQIESIIVAEANRVGLDSELAVAIATVESGLNPKAIGSKGEIGLFQLLPTHHLVKRNDVKGNVRVAIAYLSHLKTQCSKYGSAFYVCYNYGPSRHLNHPKLFPYYKKVQRVIEARRIKTNRHSISVSLQN